MHHSNIKIDFKDFDSGEQMFTAIYCSVYDVNLVSSQQVSNCASINWTLLQKVKRRKQALEKVSWPSHIKEQMQMVLCKEYTSPEKDCPNGGRIRIPFIWESSLLAKRKLELDTIYVGEVLKPVQRLRLAPVTEHPTEQCETPPPAGAPCWTVSRRYSSQ